MENQTLVKEICPTTTQQWVKEGAVLVDVREADEVAQLAYDVPNIMHIPLTQFEERYTEIPKDKPVVMVCKGGGRSLRAAGFLVNHGYENVVNMQHGIIRWTQKGFPTRGNAASVLENSLDSGCCGSTAPATAQSSSDNNPKSDGSKCC
jgi:rhodanese-related sulfurtransferase